MKPTDYDLQLIELIKSLRTREGFKLVNLSDSLGIDRSTYGRIEKGKLGFTTGQLKILARELKTNHYQLQFLVDSKCENQFYNTTFSTLLIKALKMIEGNEEQINFSEAELYYVISILKSKYEEMWSKEPDLRYK